MSLVWSLTILGAVLVVVAAVSRAERLPRNWLVGIRIPSTMMSDAAWRAGHRAGGPALATAGAVDLALAALLWMLAERPAAVPVIGTFATAATLVGAGTSVVRARAAALAVTEAARDVH